MQQIHTEIQKKYEYTIVTSHGDMNLITHIHHDEHDTIESWITEHHPTVESWCNKYKATIDAASKLAGVIVQVIGVYVSHNRAGQKLK